MTELYGFRSSAVSVLAGHGKSTVFEHMEIVKSVTPAPLLTMSKHNLDMLKSFTPIVPVWLDKALPEQRVEARRRVEASVTAHTALNDAMAGVKALKEFAEPLLKKRISEFFNLDLDVNKTWIELTRPARLFPPRKANTSPCWRQPFIISRKRKLARVTFTELRFLPTSRERQGSENAFR